MKEEEIRPQHIVDEYLRLCERDIHTFFAGVPRDYHACPACRGAGQPVFVKNGFGYESCAACDTLFVNPRPSATAFRKYYTDSESSLYSATTFYKETAQARREKLWKPKTRMIRDALVSHGAHDHHVIDVGGGYGLFAQELRNLTGQLATVIEPAPHLAAVCRDASLAVVEKFLEEIVPADLPAGPKAFVSFELFEHLHDPAAFLDHLKGLMSEGDLFAFTTLSGTGVDIQALWNNSKAVSPPHHLNFLNPRSIRILLGRVGFKVLEVTTPGKLDVDILVNNRGLIQDRFWRTFAGSADTKTQEEWQALIASSGWSSHMMTLCRKPGD